MSISYENVYPFLPCCNADGARQSVGTVYPDARIRVRGGTVRYTHVTNPVIYFIGLGATTGTLGFSTEFALATMSMFAVTPVPVHGPP